MGGQEGLLVMYLRSPFKLTGLSTWMHDVATAWTMSLSVLVNTDTNYFYLFISRASISREGVLFPVTRQYTMPSSHKRTRDPTQQVGEVDGDRQVRTKKVVAWTL